MEEKGLRSKRGKLIGPSSILKILTNKVISYLILTYLTLAISSLFCDS